MGLITIFHKSQTRSIALALRQVLQLFDFEITLRNMSRIFELPPETARIVIIWSPHCSLTDVRDWLRKLNPKVPKATKMNISFLEVGNTHSAFLAYLETNGAKRLSLPRIIFDSFVASDAAFSPQPVGYPIHSL